MVTTQIDRPIAVMHIKIQNRNTLNIWQACQMLSVLRFWILMCITAMGRSICVVTILIF